jgi:Flp pilus assembly protein TadD
MSLAHNVTMDTSVVLAAAYAALQSGEPTRAVELSKALLRSEPGREDALTLLGLALHAQQRHRDASRVFQTLTEINPAESAHWANLGTMLREAKEPDQALAAYARAAALGANSADFLLNVALLHLDRGDYQHGERLLADARAAAPKDASIAIQYAQVCYELLRIDAATQALTHWQQLDGLSAEHLAQIALLLLNLGNASESATVVRRLMQESAPGPAALLKLCQILERNNRVEDAQSGLYALQADARSATLGDELTLLQAQLAQRQQQHDRAAELFQGIAAREAAHRRHLALFPLAKSLQALGQTERAWQVLQQAHAAQLLQLARSHPQVAACDEPPLLITRHSCDPADIATWQHNQAPDRDHSPVFVVAFPRSGTTLLEQALDAHPQLVSMDEQPFLQQVADRVGDLGVEYPAALGQLTGSQLDELRAHYWSLVASKVTVGSGRRLVDKNPLNLLRLPIIQRLFPHAPIIVAIRHPLDVIVSCYAQHFRAPEFALLCKDPLTLARGFRRCFDFWYAQAGLLNPPAMEIRYEDLVADFDTSMHKLADFLAAPWDDAMLRPAEHARAKGYISTPSYSQVVEPVHARAVGRWLVHREALAPTIEVLRPYLARWNYLA